jgi:hypothetical protein
MQKMVIRMQFKFKELGITQLSRNLFVLAYKNNHEMFRNSPSIPSANDSEYQIQWGSPGDLR